MVQRYGFFVKHAKKHVFDKWFVKFVLRGCCRIEWNDS